MLNLFIFLSFIIISILILKPWLDRRLKNLGSDYESTKVRRDTLLKKSLKLKQVNAGLSGDVRNLIDFYEITKELTRYRTPNEVFVVFRDRLKTDLALQDCQLIDSGIAKPDLPGYEFFPININKELIGHLAVKGLKAEDKDKFYILFNQLLLILKRVRLYMKISELSITDSLTGLYLRRYFQERLIEEVKRCDKLGLGFVFLMMDLDNFKSYNDRYGHLVGDAILSTAARIIKEGVRQIDIVSRYGGEEFSIILPDTDRQKAEYVSRRLCRSIENEHIRAYDEDLRITISIGGSIYPKDANNAQLLIDRADQAMYRAKQTGRNRVCFWDK